MTRSFFSALVLVLIILTLLRSQPLPDRAAAEQADVSRLAELTQQLRIQSTAPVKPLPAGARAVAVNMDAAERLALMEKLARVRPDAVVLNALSAEERLLLQQRRLPVERTEAIEAAVNVVVHDGFGERPTVYEFTYGDARASAFAAPGQVSGLACGDVARLQLLVAGDAHVVASSELIAASPSPGCSPFGEQRMAVILMRRPNSAQPASTAGYWQQRLFGLDTLSVSDFVAASSYGQASVKGEVFGWYTASQDYACSDLETVRQLALEAASGDVDYGYYTRIILICQASAGEDCGAGGYGTVGCQSISTPQGSKQLSISWLFIRSLAEPTPSSPAMTTTIHEVGHNLGLHHARALNFGDDVLAASSQSGTRSEYGDIYSMMGGTGDFSAKHKQYLGWLQGETEVQQVSSGGRFSLSRLQSAGPHPRALRVRRSFDSDEWLWLEARNRSGWEFPATSVFYEDVALGVFLRYEDVADWASDRYTDRLSTDVPRLDPRRVRPKLKPGEPWRDRHGPLRLEVVSQSDEVTEVQVEYINPCAAVSAPGEYISEAGGSLLFSVHAPASCTWNVVSDASYATFAGPVESSGDGTVEFLFAPHDSEAPRTANLTIGHQVFRITQTGTLVAPEVSAVTFLEREAIFDEETGFQVLLRDGKGVRNLDKLELRIGTSIAHPFCAVTVDFPARQFSLLDTDLQTPVHVSSLENPVEGATPLCRLTVMNFRPHLLQSNAPSMPVSFRAVLIPPFEGVTSAAMAFYVRVTGLDGNLTNWTRVRSFSVKEPCVPLTAGSRLVLDQAARSIDYRVSAPAGCLWSAFPGESVLDFDTNWRVGSQLLSMAVPEGSGIPSIAHFEVGARDKELVRTEPAGQVPVLPGPESVVHGASFLEGIASGSWLSIFGTNLASVPGAWEIADFADDFLPLGLNGVEVIVDGNPVPVAFASPGQLNALLPPAIAAGPVQLQVRTPFGESEIHTIAQTDVAPGFFVFYSEGMAFAAGHDASYIALGPHLQADGGAVQRPAKVGETISVYGTGFGETRPVLDEMKLLTSPAPLLNGASASVTLGGVPCPIQFIGKSGNGLYQLNLVVPSLPNGNHELVLRIDGVSSQPGVWVRVEP